jgi:hypothetical protein
MGTQWTEQYYSDEVNGAHLEREDFPEMQVDYDTKLGTNERLHSFQEAHTVWAKLLRARGYRPIGNRTWVRDGHRAVIVP